MLATLVGLVLLVAPVARSADAGSADPERVQLIIFYGEGCPYCARELAFLDELQDRQPLLEVERYEVWNNAENRQLFQTTAAEFGVDAQAVPTTFLGEAVWVGFDSTVQQQIEDAVAALTVGMVPAVPDRTSVDVPFVGTVDVGDSSLIVATLVIGFVDGVNPCSLWVLSVLLALVLHSGSRRRVAAVGGVFLLVTSTMYGLYMVGSYSALSYAGSLDWIQRGVALVVGVLVLLLDAAPEVLERRMRGRQLDRFEQEGDAFHQRVRNGFREMAAADPQHWVTIDAGQPVDTVVTAIRDAVRERLGI